MSGQSGRAGDQGRRQQVLLSPLVPAAFEPEADEFIKKYCLRELGDDFRTLMVKAIAIQHWANQTANYSDLQGRVPELTDNDVAALQTQGRWRDQPKGMIVGVAINSIAAIIQGWDQSGTNGANLFWTSYMGISVDGCFNLQTPDRSSECVNRTLILGLVNAAPYIMIAFLACWLSDPSNHFLGRKWTITIGAMFSVIAPLASASVNTWQGLLGTRLLLGVGMGLKEVTVPILTAEIAPRQIRGALVMSWQMFTAVGIALGCVANLLSLEITQNPDNVWRYQLGSACIPAALLLLTAWTGPESPRWLVRKRKMRRAYRTLQRLCGPGNELVAAKELYNLDKTLNDGKNTGSVRFRASRHFWNLFTKARNQRAMAASSIVMISQQLCGINILSFYSSTIFATIVNNDGDQYKSAQSALLFAFGAALANFIFAAPALRYIDRLGRRPLLLRTSPFMALFLLLAGLCSLIQDEKVKFGTVVGFLYLFVIAYSPGMGPVPFTYAAEVFPIGEREVGMGWAVAMNNLFGSALSLAFPSIWDKFQPQGTGPFLFFAGLNGISFILVFLFVRETQNLSLEEMDINFEPSVLEYIQDEVMPTIPWPRHREGGLSHEENMRS